MFFSHNTLVKFCKKLNFKHKKNNSIKRKTIKS